MKSKKKILSKLYSLQRFGIKPGLERTLKLLEFLGNPHSSLQCIHVAGTNGKGSVCSMLASILTSAGLKTGLYTSPHLVDFNERIRINGVKIANDELVKYAEQLEPMSDTGEFTFFEITTAIAFKYFSEQNVDIAIIEAGMGGRFDSTNVVTPLISVITKIDLDHKEYLGDTTEQIAFEKAGIIKNGVPCVVSANKVSVRDIFSKKASETGSDIIFADKVWKGRTTSWNKDFSMLVDISTKSNPVSESVKIFKKLLLNQGRADKNFKYNNLKIGLSGKHQLANLMTVVTVFEILKDRFKLDEMNLRAGLMDIKKNTGIESRIELIRHKPPLVIDVAHNPPAIEYLVDTLELGGYSNLKWNIIYASMSDKDIEAILTKLHPICNTLILTKPKIERSANLEELEGFALNAGFEIIIEFENVIDAVDHALILDEPMLVAGSFYLVGEALHYLRKIKYNLSK